MRITESRLRQLIREDLNGGSDLVGIAAFSDARTEEACFIAYKIAELEAVVQDPNVVVEGSPGEYYGVIAGVILSPPNARAREGHDRGPCNGSWTVDVSASSQKGWGTKVYLAALDHLKIISSDRSSVSPSAEAMWKKLARYGFVEQGQFDDIVDPQTPPKSDDCQVFKARDPALNSSWKLIGVIPADIKSLMSGGEDHLHMLKQKGLREKAEIALYVGFSSLFDDSYDD